MESQFKGGGGKGISIEGRSEEKDSNEKVSVKEDEGPFQDKRYFHLETV